MILEIAPMGDERDCIDGAGARRVTITGKGVTYNQVTEEIQSDNPGRIEFTVIYRASVTLVGATNLIPNMNFGDIYIRDRDTKETAIIIPAGMGSEEVGEPKP